MNKAVIFDMDGDIKPLYLFSAFVYNDVRKMQRRTGYE